VKKLLIIPALAILVGCGGGGGNTPNLSIDKDLLGSWSKACSNTVFDNQDGDNYEIQKITFQKDGTAVYKETYYTDEACTDATGNGTTTSGTYSAGEETIASDGEKAKKLDIHIKDRNEYTMYRFDENKTSFFQANWGSDGSHTGTSDSDRANNFDDDPEQWFKN